MKGFKGTRGLVIFLILIGMLLCYYFYLSNRKEEAKEEPVEMTQVQEVLLHDLDRNYPATPKEVIKYYSEITQCFYNGDYSEKELQELSDKAMELYDQELADFQTEEYMNRLKSEIASFKQEEIQVSSYKVSSSTDVEYFTSAGRECAKLYCTYTLRKGTTLQSIEEMFILRKDGDGHWKILGWEEARKSQ